MDIKDLEHAVTVATESLRESIERLGEEEPLTGDDFVAFIAEVESIIGFLELAAGISYNDKEV